MALVYLEELRRDARVPSQGCWGLQRWQLEEAEREDGAHGEAGTALHLPGQTLRTGAWRAATPLLQPAPLPLFPFPLRKRPFAEFVLLHPPPPQIPVSYSHLNQFCSPTECRSVASRAAPCYSRPPAIHFLTNFLLTRVSAVSRITSGFGLNRRITSCSPAKNLHFITSARRCVHRGSHLFWLFFRANGGGSTKEGAVRLEPRLVFPTPPAVLQQAIRKWLLISVILLKLVNKHGQ